MIRTTELRVKMFNDGTVRGVDYRGKVAPYKSATKPHDYYFYDVRLKKDVRRGRRLDPDTVEELTIFALANDSVYRDEVRMAIDSTPNGKWNSNGWYVEDMIVLYKRAAEYRRQNGFSTYAIKRDTDPAGGAQPVAEPATTGRFTEPTEPTKGTEPKMPNPTTTTTVAIDENLLRELRDAIKAMNHKPTALEERILQAVIDKTRDIATAELEQELKSKLDNFIEKTYGALPKRLEVVIPGKDPKTITGILHEKFEVILKMLTSDIPVMLTGAAGTGKNHTLAQVAEAMGIEFYYTGAITQEYKLTGFIDAGGRYHETEFYKAFTKGGLFMLDEVDASSAETLVLLNGAIANKYFDFPNGRAKAHHDFRIACAGNTFGTGADMVYVGRNVLDGATLDRFVVIKMDYDEQVERQLCPDAGLYAFIKDMRHIVNKYHLRHIVGMRASINGYKALQAGMDKAFIIESIVMKGMSRDDLSTVISNMGGRSPWHTALADYAASMGTR